MIPIGCSETSARICHSNLHKTSKVSRSRDESYGLDSRDSLQCVGFQEVLGNGYRRRLSDYEHIRKDFSPLIILLFSFFINQTYTYEALNDKPVGISNS